VPPSSQTNHTSSLGVDIHRADSHRADSPSSSDTSTPAASALFAKEYAAYKQAVERALGEAITEQKPESLYEPMRYILAAGGKRVRPVLTMMSCAAVGGNPYDALYGGLAVEIMHNFTLVHDDIMDAADMRRGRATVHKRWNESAAILCGDGMMALGFQIVLRSPQLSRLQEIVQALTVGVMEVCEGQAFDLEFQDTNAVTLADYLVMIEKKTAKMLELAVVMGALIGNGTDAEMQALKRFALAVGKAFQIQDDLLDATAESAEFGKTIGGDIIEGKKTYLVLRTLEQRDRFTAAENDLMERFLCNRGLPQADVPAMRDLMQRLGVLDDARAAVQTLTNEAYSDLQHLSNPDGKALLAGFADMLLQRSY
jgi:geranylgeranyl diphosphate synthase, type II